MNDILTVAGKPGDMTESEMRDRVLTALEVVLCKHGRTQTFAMLVRDVLEIIEQGDGSASPPMLLVADPSPEQVSSCREQGVVCPPSPRIASGLILGGLAEAWERRVRRLVKQCDPLAGDSRRVVEAKWNPGSRGKSCYWSLLLDCGHVVKKRTRTERRTHVPRHTRCCLCSKKEESK